MSLFASAVASQGDVRCPHTAQRPDGHRRRLARWALVLCVLPTVAAQTGCGATQIETKKRLEKADFHYKLAAGYFHAHSVDLAIRELMKSFSYDKEQADSRYLFGFILFGRKRHEEAVLNFKRALKRRPKFFAARNHLGVTYLELERWQDAIDVLKPLLKEPTYTTPYLPYNNIGWAYMKLGRLNEAAKNLQMAVFVNPKFCQGHRNLGLLAEKRGDRVGAQRHLEAAARRCPKVATFHFSLGNLYCRGGIGSKAEAAYKRCTAIAGTSLLGKRCAARVDLAHNGGCQ